MSDDIYVYPVGEVGDIIIIENIVLHDTLLPNDDSLPDITKILLRVDKDFLLHRPAKIVERFDRALSDGTCVYIATCLVEFRITLFDGEFKILGDIS